MTERQQKQLNIDTDNAFLSGKVYDWPNTFEWNSDGEVTLVITTEAE
jgi:hypothetical protein